MCTPKKSSSIVLRNKRCHSDASSNQLNEADVMRQQRGSLILSKQELLGCFDLTRLPYLYDDVVLECINERYSTKQIYTWAGPILVAANPFYNLKGLYDNQKIKDVYNSIKEGNDSLVPHVFSVAGLAHHRLLAQLGNCNQAVLVSGESGAGKTESAKYILTYLTTVESNSQTVSSPLKGVWKDRKPQDIQQQILASNPVLEAFGNAATVRNHNSSRFGKLIRLQYHNGNLKGADVETYLLEKTRVTHQPTNERNFHIFHQVYAGAKNGLVEGVKLEENDLFCIIPETSLKQEEADSKAFKQTCKALRQLSFTEKEVKDLINVVIGIMYLGNITFQSTRETWKISTIPHCVSSMQKASEYLGITTEGLTSCLTQCVISVSVADKENIFTKPCERESQCTEKRDALMQLLYAALFRKLICNINLTTSAPIDTWQHFLGILDIYGFETFDDNSLEQLCINYANERLQLEFTKRYLASEHKILLEEGLLDVPFTCSDNSDCVSVLDSNVSVFAILNEACQLRRALNEGSACERICDTLSPSGLVLHQQQQQQKQPFTPKRLCTGFTIKHYAGPVSYSSSGILQKNKDEVALELLALVSQSNDVFVSGLTTSEHTKQMQARVTPGKKVTRKVTTLAKFKGSLDILINCLSGCDLHYVRCIKPNHGMVYGISDSPYLLDQLRSNGILETVRISQAGYPVRMLYHDFTLRYAFIHPSTTPMQNICKSVLQTALGNDAEDLQKCRLGKNRIFLCESSLHKLEVMRRMKRNNAATIIQKNIRMYLVLVAFKQIVRSVTILQSASRCFIARQKYLRLQRNVILLQRIFRGSCCRRRYAMLKLAVLVLQKHIRGWICRKKQCNTKKLQNQMQRSISNVSFLSITSTAYGSLTASSHADLCVSDAETLVMGCEEAQGPMIGAHRFPSLYHTYNPSHQLRLQETEESGIETDTESLSGEIWKTGRQRVTARFRHSWGSSKYDINMLGTVSVLADSSQHVPLLNNDTNEDQMLAHECAQKHNLSLMHNHNIKQIHISESSPHEQPRVATVKCLKEVSALLKTTSASENLQIYLPYSNRPIFFKDGILSYRRMPAVAIKFHTRQTCLPFSTRLPFQETTHGLIDAIR